MMKDSPCESCDPLDLSHVSTHGDKEPKSPNSTTDSVSSPVLASVTDNFP